MQNPSTRKPLYLATRQLSLLLAGATLAASLPVMAQSSNSMLEETIVTAQHREENVQDIPVTVTALSAKEMQEAQIFGAAQIAYKAPGMTYAEFAPGQALLSMRGISSSDDGAGMDNSVALFLDGVYIGKGASINFNMFDLERIEVLRGPQGTLFGRNAVGGALNIITSKPTDELTAKVGVTGGNEGQLRYQGLISGPLGDNFAGKLSFSHREHDGFVKNTVLNKDQQDEDVDSMRGQLRFTTDNSDWLLSGDYMEDDRQDMGRVPIVAGGDPNTVELWKAGGGSSDTVLAPADGGSHREAEGISLTGDIEFGPGTFTSITAWRHAETDWQMASIGVAWNGGAEVIDNIQEEIDTYTQEFRWTSNLDGPLNYTGGLYFLRENTDRREAFELLFGGGAPGGTGTYAIFGNEISEQDNVTKSYAAYIQGDYAFNDQWILTLGGRFTYDDKRTQSTSVNCGNTPGDFEGFKGCESGRGSLGIIPNTFKASGDDNWNDFSPKVSLQYHPNDDVMFFGTAAKGFKSGGFGGAPGTITQATTAVDAETVWNYEAGMKGDFLDSSLRLNATAFYMDYEDLQIVRFGPTAESPEFGQFVTTNLGSADIAGVEVEVTWYPTENLRLSGNYAYLNTEVDGLVIETSAGEIDASGSDLRQAPENSGALTAAYNIPLNSGSYIDLRVDYTFVDEQIMDYIQQETVVEEAKLWDARASWTSADEAWNVALWGKNLTDEKWISHSYVIGPGVIGVYAPPLTYGVSLTLSM
jgi:iron complex outermembrane receptor protein